MSRIPIHRIPIRRIPIGRVAVLLCCLAGFLCAAVLPAACASAQAGERKDAFYASVVPAGAVAVLCASSPSELIAAAGQTPLARMAAADGQLGGALTAELSRLQLLLSLVTGLPTEQYDALLKGGCAAALLRTGGGDARHLPLLLCVDLSGVSDPARNSIEKSLISSLRELLAHKNGDADKSLGSVDQTAEHTYLAKLGAGADQQLSVVFRKNLLLAGFKADVDGLAQGPGIGTDELFARIAEKVPLADGISGYVNAAALLDELDARLPNLRRHDALQMLGIDSFGGCGFSTTFDAAGVTDRLYLSFAPQKRSWVRFLPAKPSQLAGERFVPKDFDVYISADVGRGEFVWDAARVLVEEFWGAEGLEDYDNRNEAIELPFGVSLRNDIFGAIEGEVFFAIDLDRLAESLADGGIDQQKTPYLFGFRTTKKDVLMNALARVLQSDVLWGQLGIEEKRQMVGKYETVRLVSPYEPSLMAGYAFADGYFLFSPSYDVVERAIVAHASGTSLDTDAAFADMKKRMPKESNVQIFARAPVVYRELLKAYEAGLDDKVLPVAQTLKPNIDKLGSAMASVWVDDKGIAAQVCSPGGLAATMASARMIRRASARLKVQHAWKLLNETAAAVDKYYAARKSCPAQLDQLVPEYMPDLPADPFGTWGMPLRYVAKPGADGGSGCYVLASNGPDEKIDVDLSEFDAAKWLVKTEAATRADGRDDAALAEMKALVYQFHKETNPDEADVMDEGDIILVRTPPAGKVETK